MKTLPYQQAFERIRAEFLEMRGMHLTPEQVERLSGVERATCTIVLDDLVRAGFLCIAARGSYCRVRLAHWLIGTIQSPRSASPLTVTPLARGLPQRRASSSTVHGTNR